MKLAFIPFGLLCLISSLQSQVLLNDQVSQSEFQWVFDTSIKHACKTSNSNEIVETPIDQCHFLEAFKLYPNPANVDITIEFKALVDPIQLYISDINGQLVFSGTKNIKSGHFNKNISVEKLDPGIYILSILHNKKAFNRKLVIE